MADKKVKPLETVKVKWNEEEYEFKKTLDYTGVNETARRIASESYNYDESGVVCKYAQHDDIVNKILLEALVLGPFYNTLLDMSMADFVDGDYDNLLKTALGSGVSIPKRLASYVENYVEYLRQKTSAEYNLGYVVAKFLKQLPDLAAIGDEIADSDEIANKMIEANEALKQRDAMPSNVLDFSVRR